MNCKELGYKVGDKFEVLKEQHGCFSVGTIVELVFGGESIAPVFKDENGVIKCLYLPTLKKIETGKTLLEILAEELPKRGGWPEGVDRLAQDPDKEIQKLSNRNVYLCSVGWNGNGRNDFRGEYIRGINDLAIDYKTAIITRDQYEAALAEKNEGWIQWGGGACPVEKGTLVDVRYRDGVELLAQPASKNTSGKRDAGYAFWRNDASRSDIIAYRLSKPEDEKQVEYDYGHISADFEDDHIASIESLTDAIIEYGCEANLAYPLAKHLLSKGLFK